MCLASAKNSAAPAGAVDIQEPGDGLRAADRHDRDALGREIAATAPSERLERALVADALDEHDSLLSLVHISILAARRS